MALLFSVFTVPQVSMLHWKWLSMCQRDDWDFCVGQLKRIALDKFHKLMEPCKKQFMWVLQELIRARAKNLDGVFSGLLRHVASGDYTPKNTQLAASLLKMLQDNKAWLYASPRLISVVYFTFTRLITDHLKQPALTALRQQEINFTSTLLREKFEEVRVIGRDLIRLIDENKKFPEYEVIWKDLLHKPNTFSPTLTNITDLLSVRTPPKYFASRLTPDMEAQLMFILKNVKMGNQKRYQTWFMQKYMPATDSETLVPDLIRYICCNYHPPNHVLCSDIVPRWAIIGWLLKCIKTKYVGHSAKMALFWDWFSYDQRTDNIMNIEPAILLMVHSIPKYPDMTATLLDFLATAIESFDEQRRDFARKGVHNSFSVCLGKNVVTSLAPLFNCPTLEPSLKKKLHPIFRPFLKEDQKPSGTSSPLLSSGGSPTLPSSPLVSPQKTPQSSSTGQTTATLPKLPFPQLADADAFVGRKGSTGGLDNFDLMLMDKPLISPKRQASPTEEMYSRTEPVAEEVAEEEPEKGKSVARTDIPQSLLPVERPLGKLIDSLSEDGSRSFEVQSSNLHHLVAHFVKMSSSAKYSQEAATDLAQFFANALAKEFVDFAPETVLSARPALHFNLFSAEPSPPFALLDILHELRLLIPSLGFRFLVWLIVHGIKGIDRRRRSLKGLDERSPEDENDHHNGLLMENVDNGYTYMGELHEDILSPYATLVEHSMSKGSAESQDYPFLLDCKWCAEESMDLFAQMVPYVFRYLPEYVRAYRVELVQLIVANADPTHIESLACKLTLGEFEMFGPRDAPFVIEQSLGWDSISQFCLWQFLTAEFNHGVDGVEEVAAEALDILRLQDRSQTQEFVQGLLLLLRTAALAPTLLQAVFALPLSFAHLSCALFNQWSARDVRAFFPLLFGELQRVIAKSVAPAEAATNDDEDEGEGRESRGRVDRKYAKRVAGHLDRWCLVMRASLRRGPDADNLAVLSGLLQRVLRAYDLTANHYDGLPTLLQERRGSNNSSVGSPAAVDPNKKRKRASSGSSSATTSSALSATIGGETAVERDKRRRALSKDGSPHLSPGGSFDPHAKKRRLSPTLDHNDAASDDSDNRAVSQELELERQQNVGERRSGGSVLAASSPQLARHSAGSGFRPGSPSVIPQGSGQRHSSTVSLTSSSGGIPRRASNGALDENKPGRPEPPPPKRKRSLSGSSAHLRPPEGAATGDDRDDTKGDGGADAGAARKRKVKRISMEHETEFDQ